MWKPIETAPKDGTEILVYFDLLMVPIVHLARFRNAEEWEEIGKYLGFGIEDWLGWWHFPESAKSPVKLEGSTAPTHWIPLPKLPR